MKWVTLIVKLPMTNPSYFIKKVWTVATYLKDEVSIKPLLVFVKSEDNEPQLIVMDEVISLYSDVDEIVNRVTSRLAMDVADTKFLDSIAAATSLK